MTKYITTAVAAGAFAFGVAQSQAAAIDGSIGFAPTKVVSTTPNDWTTIPLTVNFKPGPNAIINDAGALTGDFSTMLPNADTTPYSVTFKTFTTDTVGTVPALWAVVGGGPAISFDLTSSSNFSADNNFLSIAGTGVIHAPGFDDTTGFFTLQANRTDPANQIEFFFTASTTTHPPTVPDGGATAMLLGLGAIGVGALARRK
jgi:hypothetical protein